MMEWNTELIMKLNFSTIYQVFWGLFVYLHNAVPLMLLYTVFSLASGPSTYVLYRPV